ncbi:hypothetical protein JCM19241_3876 [Vibrio ishigakensis]|uniref:Secreted protein n=1 Tax=Vibrio ishigakensis TaxID=1481914 RepID=A0A0B8QPM4_9VIBR|nr:hypothetical protein JCM19241_3876 [Vibrio ishigakensis]
MKFIYIALISLLLALQLIPMAFAKVNNNSDKHEIIVYCASNPDDQSTKCNKLKKKH